jgi:hypothetical protein
VIILNSNDKSLVGRLSTNPTTASPSYIVQYADVTLNGQFEGVFQDEGFLFNSSPTSISSFPISKSRRDIKYVKFHNNDSTSVNFELFISSSIGEMPIFNGIVKSHYTLFYNAEGEIHVVDNQGANLLSTISTPSSFTDLGDVPHSYFGQQGSVVVVNNSETGLTFSDTAIASSSYAVTASYVSSQNSTFETFTLTQTDIDNKFILLSNAPQQPFEQNVMLFIKSCGIQQYGSDFYMDNTITVKMYFGNSIQGNLEVGDMLTVNYIVRT